MDAALRALMGPPQRLVPSRAAAWLEIEDWVGRPLPEDYKEFVDEFGDCRIMEFLAIPHPEGRDGLLESMRDDREFLEVVGDQYRDSAGILPFDPATAVGWASHDYDGDVCFLLPREDGHWAVMIAFRQRRMVLIEEEGFTAFMVRLLGKDRVPSGWPVVEPLWRSIDESPVI
ncbi:SMI1/KNR4 family protein [Kitasatospora aureofaciens]|uniref:SMI1/KNR4 family protein n=1 Tax=Kitasatospora aureofaciens TaxID=1894 RepID=UPI000526FD88|nr:SMI1/KNR4 family protein [Kitasatospora aureofaciens]